MPRYIDAVTAAEIIADKTGMPITELVDVFAGIPTADVAPVVHGEWVEGVDGMTCPNCFAYWNYCDNDCERFDCCPSCGAKMDGGAK